MESIFTDRTLTVKPDGRIDTSNASEVKKELFELVDEHKPEKIIVDAEKLEYISSVGLRVVLKLKKTVDDTSIINASPEIYDIFDMTGFTDIIEVKKAFREISVEGCEVIGKGGNGTVYRLDGDTIVKLYGENESFDDIKREISYSKTAFVFGIPTAISFDIVKCGSCYGIVFELINADTLANRICAEPEKFDEYSMKYSAIVKKLHDTEADTSIFANIKGLYNKWIDELSGTYTPDERSILHEVINSTPDSSGIIHGDIHPKNIMVQDDELLFIDMADLSYGHHIFDYAGIALTHILAKPYVKQMFGIEADTAEKLYNNMINANFSGRTDREIEKIKSVILGYAGIKYALSPAISKTQDLGLNKLIIKKAKEQIIPNAKRLIGAIDF
ncbi:MAG: anti-sigma factor antagonist [Oscillospiraceae bacterium]|nr:anti-sigma factor antagonist [Oscillospiraceae bacterium]